jgi:hypothetical protein
MFYSKCNSPQLSLSDQMDWIKIAASRKINKEIEKIACSFNNAFQSLRKIKQKAYMIICNFTLYTRRKIEWLLNIKSQKMETLAVFATFCPKTTPNFGKNSQSLHLSRFNVQQPLNISSWCKE